MRGGERVLEQIAGLYPDADIFTHALDRSRLSPTLRDRNIRTTFVGRIPFAARHYQKLLPLMPRALEALDLSGYDLVISSESGPAKGVITRPDATHVTYCHSPMRYLWDQYHDYLQGSGLAARISMPLFAPSLRVWDAVSAQRSDAIMANSDYVRRRIAKFWGREATVVHPPVDTALFTPGGTVSDEWLWAGQLVPYKRPDLAVEAFNANGRPLHIVGDGAMLPALRRRARPNIRFSTRLDFADLRRAYAGCKALLFTAEEDFGLVPVEVMASGRPVLAFGRGGALETVAQGRTGLFYGEKSVAALQAAIERFEAWLPGFDPRHAVEQAGRFSPEQFRQAFAGVVEAAIRRGSGQA
jgi:glycosyltransferase involved in cell wall biosynthesis